MKKYSFQDIINAFQTLGINRGDCLFIHSSILDFGFPTDIPISELPQTIFQLLSSEIGKNGTLVVPAFNFGFCKGKPFDIKKSPSLNMGVFAEYVRNHTESKRSPHPMQSIAAIGKFAGYLTENDTSSAFDPESAFDRLTKLETRVLLLGSNFSYNSIFHWVEQKQQVPYRFWKNFTGLYTGYDHQTSEKTYRMYVRDLEEDLELDFTPIEEELQKNNKISSVGLGSGYLQLYDLNDFLKVAENGIQKNPFCFIQK